MDGCEDKQTAVKFFQATVCTSVAFTVMSDRTINGAADDCSPATSPQASCPEGLAAPLKIPSVSHFPDQRGAGVQLYWDVSHTEMSLGKYPEPTTLTFVIFLLFIIFDYLKYIRLNQPECCLTWIFIFYQSFDWWFQFCFDLAVPGMFLHSVLFHSNKAIHCWSLSRFHDLNQIVRKKISLVCLAVPTSFS